MKYRDKLYKRFRIDDIWKQVGSVRGTVGELNTEIKRRTTVNRKLGSLYPGFVIYSDDSTPPEVSVVDAVQLILDHLGLEIVENEKLSLAKKQEESNG